MAATPTKPHECEIWLLCDEDGNYVVEKDLGNLAEEYDDQIGNNSSCARRCVRLVVRVPVEEYVTLTGTAPQEGTATLTVLEAVDGAE